MNPKCRRSPRADYSLDSKMKRDSLCPSCSLSISSCLQPGGLCPWLNFIHWCLWLRVLGLLPPWNLRAPRGLLNEFRVSKPNPEPETKQNKQPTAFVGGWAGATWQRVPGTWGSHREPYTLVSVGSVCHPCVQNPKCWHSPCHVKKS